MHTTHLVLKSADIHSFNIHLFIHPSIYPSIHSPFPPSLHSFMPIQVIMTQSKKYKNYIISSDICLLSLHFLVHIALQWNIAAAPT